MLSVTGIGHTGELPDKHPVHLLLHPKLVFDASGITSKQLFDPQLT